jgi:hypothetical protein
MKAVASAFISIFCICLLFLTPMAEAQDRELEMRDIRISIIPGLSTNGIDAHNYTARFSLNILAGYNGGLDGFEIGPLNMNHHYTRGVQIGGLNYSAGRMQGLNIAAGANYSRGDMKGIQLAGFVNASEGVIQGIQLAGIANSNWQSTLGLQFAGITNISRREVQGIQVAGVVNANTDNAQGLYFGGFGNVNTGRAQGLFFAGAVNVARDFQGISFAGVANATRNMHGIQISGLVNGAYRATGVQIGVINFAREFQGIPVGLISAYGNGRHNIDIWTTDGGFSHIGLKLGTRHIYNMVSLGYNPLITGRDVWSWGWTIGSYRDLAERWNDPRYEGYFSKSDFSIQNIQEGRAAISLDNLFTYRFLLGKDFTGGFKMYAGPTLNLLISKQEEANEYTWYSILSGTTRDRGWRVWVGLTIGMQFFGH